MIDTIFKLQQHKSDLKLILNLIQDQIDDIDNTIKPLYKEEVDKMLGDKTSYIFFFYSEDDGTNYESVKGFHNQSFIEKLFNCFNRGEFVDKFDAVEKWRVKDKQIFTSLVEWLSGESSFCNITETYKSPLLKNRDTSVATMIEIMSHK